jgi:hypothetical protein
MAPPAPRPRPAPPLGRRRLAEGVGGGWLSAWVLRTEQKPIRMPMAAEEHALDMDGVIVVATQERPGLAEDDGGDNTTYNMPVI